MFAILLAANYKGQWHNKAKTPLWNTLPLNCLRVSSTVIHHLQPEGIETLAPSMSDCAFALVPLASSSLSSKVLVAS